MHATTSIAPLILVVSACGSDSHCDSNALASALGEAGSGDTVQIGDCTITGHFEVPSGVALSGEGSAKIVADSGEPALRVAARDGAPTTISDLTVVAKSGIGILARGAGAVRLERVQIDLERGVGIGVEGLSSFVASRITIDGSIDINNPPIFGRVATATEAASHGLVVIGVPDAQLNDINVSGTATYGLLLVDSTTVWSGGSSSDNLNMGLRVEGGSATLEDIEICRISQGFALDPAFGAVFAQGAAVDSNRVRVCENQGVGLVQISGRGTHRELDATNNQIAAVWAERADHFELSGALHDNIFAGFVSVESQEVQVRDLSIERTTKQLRVVGVQGQVEVGDGIQLVRNVQAQLSNVTLTENERAGILVELGGNPLASGSLQFNNVEVTVTSANQGAVVAQNGTITTGWDSGVIRHGTDAANDQRLAGSFSTLEVIGPCDHPRQSNLSSGGLVSITGF